MLAKTDPEVYQIIKNEEKRQQNKLSMIASENFFSVSLREAVGSVFSHKYSEGNIGERYYEGNEFVDQLETLAVNRAKQVFNLPQNWTANVQALSGSNANLAVYLALLSEGDTIMSMYLPDGGHLSHGWSFEPDKEKREADLKTGSIVYLGGSRRVHLTSRLYKVVQYKTDQTTKLFDYDKLADIALKYRPKLLITGGTAYPRNIDYLKMKKIADSVNAYYLADIAHEAGLVAAKVVPSPVGIADVVTMTTHKTLRAGRGAIILSDQEKMKEINRGILPGLQGGPHNHNIAGITVGLGEAVKAEFNIYAAQILRNSQKLAEEFQLKNFDVLTGGTDKHFILLDLKNQPLQGKYFARALDEAGIVTNATTLPWDSSPPKNPAGMRVGTPWLTTRGFKEPQMKVIARWFRLTMEASSPYAHLSFKDFTAAVTQLPKLHQISGEVKEICDRYPLQIHEKIFETQNL